MEEQIEETVAQPEPAKPKKGSRAALYVLIAIVIAVPLWYFFVLIPRVRVAAFKEIMGDCNARGKVAFETESGGDAYGQVKGVRFEGGVEPIPLSELKEGSANPKDPKDPGTQIVALSNLHWAGGNKYEVRAGWYMRGTKKVGTISTYVFQVSLLGCDLLEAKDVEVKGSKAPTAAPGKPGMPGLQGAGGGPPAGGGGGGMPAPSVVDPSK